MARKRRKRKQKQRNVVVLDMIMTCRPVIMHDRRTPRGGSKNDHRDMLQQAQSEM